MDAAGQGLPPVGTETAADVWTEDTGTTKPTVVDVRVETDYATSHLPYAVNWPFAVEPSGVGPFTKIIVVGTNDTDGGAATLMLTGAAPTLNRMIGGMNGYTYGLDYSPDYVESKLGTWSLCESGTISDALSTAFMVMTPAEV